MTRLRADRRGGYPRPVSSGRAAHAVDVSQFPEPIAVEIGLAIELSDNGQDIVEQGVTEFLGSWRDE